MDCDAWSFKNLKSMKTMSLFLIISLLSIVSCTKKNSTTGGDVIPANLSITTEVSTDNSGSVKFIATATNAVSYEYDFGNGVYQTVPSGTVTYKYPSSGNYVVNVTAKSSTGNTVSKTTQVAVSVALSLVWSDEFNTPGAPDPSKWGYDLGNNNGWGNNELQYYTNRAENVSISNGTLKITAKKESFSGFNYTSTRMLTKNKFTTKYGKIEARAKLPAGVGTWPAIWMLGSNIDAVGWPACGEIDIMEHKGSDQNRVYGTLHYPGRSGGNANGNTIVINNATTEFNIYTVEWTASVIKFSVNGNVFHTVNNSASIPFNHEFFIILNLAMGGTFGGPVDPAFSNATMEVDYVRVYR
jgi:beta-glucanase (GH16 family)